MVKCVYTRGGCAASRPSTEQVLQELVFADAALVLADAALVLADAALVLADAFADAALVLAA